MTGVEEIVSALEEESGRRKNQIGNLKLSVMAVQDAEAAVALLQASIVLLYAHLEGFVKISSRKYLQFLENQSPELQGLSREWLKGRSVVSASRLREIAWCLRLDYGPFERKAEAVQWMKSQRDKIAHGDMNGEAAHMRKENIEQMADDVSEIIDVFKAGLIGKIHSG